jgi:Xaa-Pro aminopeptidase
MSELKIKKIKVYALLEKRGLDGIVLAKNSNIAWLTGGMENRIVFVGEEGAVRLIVLRGKNKILVLTNNIEAKRVIEEEGLIEADFQLITKQWYDSQELVSNIAKEYKLGGDICFQGVVDLQEEIKELRFSLLPDELEKYRALGRDTSLIVSEVCKSIRPRDTENKVRGQLAKYLWGNRINPHLILVGSDERIFSYRHPTPKDKEINKYVMIAVCAERAGLIVSMTRFVHFGRLPEELKDKLQAVVKVDASFIYNSQIGNSVSDIFRRGVAAYKETGYPEEWKFHHQGGATGYEIRDYIATLTSTQVVQPNQAFAWNPSIKGVKSEDTIFVTESGSEIITDDSNWPKIEVRYGEKLIKRADILGL